VRLSTANIVNVIHAAKSNSKVGLLG